jgi:hypothetical protein
MMELRDGDGCGLHWAVLPGVLILDSYLELGKVSTGLLKP